MTVNEAMVEFENRCQWWRCLHSDALSASYHRCGCFNQTGEWCVSCRAAFHVLDERGMP